MNLRSFYTHSINPILQYDFNFFSLVEFFNSLSLILSKQASK